MPRFFIEISYRGTHYAGWQRQNNAVSVQEIIENALSKLYNQHISVVGCGRTDAGVHARQFYLHVDLEDGRFSLKDLLYKLNLMVGNTIAVHNIFQVDNEAHARFDALSRSYTYNISFNKDPFKYGLYYEYDQSVHPDFKLLQDAASLIKEYNAFFPFCKSNSDVETYNCVILDSYWEQRNDHTLRYNVTANRFLRGMVRLIVGMCINVAINKLSLPEVRKSLEFQQRLSRPWSVPAEGLFLTGISYPYINHIE